MSSASSSSIRGHHPAGANNPSAGSPTLPHPSSAPPAGAPPSGVAPSDDLMNREEFYRFYLRQRLLAQQARESGAQQPPQAADQSQPQPVPAAAPPQPAARPQPQLQFVAVLHISPELRSLIVGLFKCAILSFILARGEYTRALMFFALFSGARLLQYLSSFIKMQRPQRRAAPREVGPDGEVVAEAPRGKLSTAVQLASLFVYSIFPSWRIESLDEM